MSETVLRLELLHMEWADATLWRAVLAAPAARADGRIRDLLYHVHVVQRYYLQLMAGEPLGVPEQAALADVEALHAWGCSVYPELAAFVGGLEPAALQRPVAIPWAAQLVERFGAAREPTLEECLIQVALHTGHHRAQLCTRLRELVGEGPLVDFIAWVWLGKPEPEWPRPAVANA